MFFFFGALTLLIKLSVYLFIYLFLLFRIYKQHFFRLLFGSISSFSLLFSGTKHCYYSLPNIVCSKRGRRRRRRKSPIVFNKYYCYPFFPFFFQPYFSSPNSSAFILHTVLYSVKLSCRKNQKKKI